ncbi:MAG: hypothetical protein KatS3mg102_0647 [Planctomycetota bacterium]|nr:MAG: hypothetical protein KatS3mg102_0647 [Planctomycetota bacterium]
MDKPGAPLDCEQAAPLLSASLDGETDAATEGALARHLAACPACAARRLEAVRLERWLRELQAEAALEPPAAVWDGVAAFVQAPVAARRRRRAAIRALPRAHRWRGTAYGHPFARAVAAVLVLIGALIAVRTFSPAPVLVPDEPRPEAAAAAPLRAPAELQPLPAEARPAPPPRPEPAGPAASPPEPGQRAATGPS